jgi:hypothetical protein
MSAGRIFGCRPLQHVGLVIAMEMVAGSGKRVHFEIALEGNAPSRALVRKSTSELVHLAKPRLCSRKPLFKTPYGP